MDVTRAAVLLSLLLAACSPAPGASYGSTIIFGNATASSSGNLSSTGVAIFTNCTASPVGHSAVQVGGNSYINGSMLRDSTFSNGLNMNVDDLFGGASCDRASAGDLSALTRSA